MTFLLIIYTIAASALFLYSIVMIRYTISWKNLAVYKNHSAMPPSTYISIIIPVRNEEKHLEDCLNSLRSQDYPSRLFEILVINDNSTDQSALLSDRFFKKNPSISGRLINLKEDGGGHGKKIAITKGVQNANGKLIITTDADCTANKLWIRTIAEFYEENGPKLIAGPVLLKGFKSIFQKIMELEFIGLMAATASAINQSKPIMCNGANLAFEKEAFIDVGGYHGNDNILSGDDVFLLVKIHQAFPGKILFLKSKNGLVHTSNNPGLSDFVAQRSRWVSKVRMISDSNTLFVAFVIYLCNFMVLFNMITWLINPNYNGTFLFIIFGIKCIIDYLFLNLASRYFEKGNLMRYFIPAEFLNLFYVTFIGIFGNLATNKWKERNVLQ